MRDRNVIKQDVEVLGPPYQALADQRRNVRPLREELVGVELRDDGLENLVPDRREDLLVVLETEGFEDVGEAADLGAGENPEGEVDHLEVLGAGDGGEGVGPGADVEDEGLLEPWDEEVGPFADGLVDDSTETVEEDGALTAVDGVEGGVEDGGADAETEGGASHVGQE